MAVSIGASRSIKVAPGQLFFVKFRRPRNVDSIDVFTGNNSSDGEIGPNLLVARRPNTKQGRRIPDRRPPTVISNQQVAVLMLLLLSLLLLYKEINVTIVFLNGTFCRPLV